MSNSQLRKLMVEIFSWEELELFCADYFSPVRSNFTSGETHSFRVQRLIDYCTKNGSLPNLLERLRDRSPSSFLKYDDGIEISMETCNFSAFETDATGIAKQIELEKAKEARIQAETLHEMWRQFGAGLRPAPPPFIPFSGILPEDVARVARIPPQAGNENSNAYVNPSAHVVVPANSDTNADQETIDVSAIEITSITNIISNKTIDRHFTETEPASAQKSQIWLQELDDLLARREYGAAFMLVDRVIRPWLEEHGACLASAIRKDLYSKAAEVKAQQALQASGKDRSRYASELQDLIERASRA